MPYVWSPFNSSCGMNYTHQDLCHNFCFGVLIKTKNLWGPLTQEKYWPSTKFPHEENWQGKEGMGLFLLETKTIFFFLDHLKVTVNVLHGFIQFIKTPTAGNKIRHVRLTVIRACEAPKRLLTLIVSWYLQESKGKSLNVCSECKGISYQLHLSSLRNTIWGFKGKEFKR